jgi:hypothetical protein
MFAHLDVLICLTDLFTRHRHISITFRKEHLVNIQFDQTGTLLVVLDADGRIASDHESDREALEASEKLPDSRVERVARKWFEAHRSNQRV